MNSSANSRRLVAILTCGVLAACIPLQGAMAAGSATTPSSIATAAAQSTTDDHLYQGPPVVIEPRPGKIVPGIGGRSSPTVSPVVMVAGTPAVAGNCDDPVG